MLKLSTVFLWQAFDFLRKPTECICDGLKDLSDATFYCKNFTPDDTRLMEAFSEAKPGTIICAEWSVLEVVDGEKVDKTLTPQSGYRKANGGSWERVEWSEGQQAADQQGEQLPPDKPIVMDQVGPSVAETD